MTNGHAAHGAGGHHQRPMPRRERAEDLGHALPQETRERYRNSLTSFMNLGNLIHAKTIHNRDLLTQLQQEQRQAVVEVEEDKRANSMHEIGLKAFLRSKIRRKTPEARAIHNRPNQLQEIITFET